MADILKPLGMAALIAFAAPAFAQDAETPAADAPAAEAAATEDAPSNQDLDMGQDVAPAVPQVETYVDGVFGDWERECIRIQGREGADPCQMAQLLYFEGEENPAGRVSIVKLPEAEQATAGAIIALPLGVMLQQQITLTIDSAQPKRYAYRACDPSGCMAQVGFTAAEIEGFKAGAKATITVASVARPDQPIALDLSLTGFTDAWNSLELPTEAVPAQ